MFCKSGGASSCSAEYSQRGVEDVHRWSLEPSSQSRSIHCHVRPRVSFFHVLKHLMNMSMADRFQCPWCRWPLFCMGQPSKWLWPWRGHRHSSSEAASMRSSGWRPCPCCHSGNRGKSGRQDAHNHIALFRSAGGADPRLLSTSRPRSLTDTIRRSAYDGNTHRRPD